MLVFFIAIFIIISLTLAFVILIQPAPEGDGLMSMQVENVMTHDHLENITKWLATIYVILCLVMTAYVQDS